MKLRLALLLAFGLSFLGSFTLPSEEVKFKCLVQLNSYRGEGAYVVVSLMNPAGEYEKTLYMFGKEKRWYDDIPQWWRFYAANRTSLDGISGASISSDSRKLIALAVGEDKLNKGYSLRFESAVEHKSYYEKDVEFELTAANIGVSKSGVKLVNLWSSTLALTVKFR